MRVIVHSFDKTRCNSKISIYPLSSPSCFQSDNNTSSLTDRFYDISVSHIFLLNMEPSFQCKSVTKKDKVDNY